MSNEEQAYIAWSHIPGIGNSRFEQVFSYFGSAYAALCAPVGNLCQVLPEQLALGVHEWRSTHNMDAMIQRYQKSGTTVIARCNPLYPPQFLRLPNPPVCVYIKGYVSDSTFQEKRCISIVGTRKSTPYGDTLAYKFGKELAEEGYSVVSGLAMGIDAQSHWGCISGNGTPIAILGNGVDIVYPARNIALYKAILDKGGVLMSEYPPGEHAAKGMFVMRNRLISALSRATVVVEGEIKSGSMITAKAALELNKDVFAPPVPITSSASEGPNYLIQQGAFLITKTSDILQFYGETSTVQPSKKTFNATEEKVLQIIQYDGTMPDIAAQQLQMPVQQLLGIVTGLQIKKAVVLKPDGRYYRSL